MAKYFKSHGSKFVHHGHGKHDADGKGVKLKGTNGNDILPGTALNDWIFGRKGDDKIDGGAGNDKLFGGKGNDVLFGGAGNDLLFGGKGDDLLDGGAGSDIIRAGKGDDTVDYILSANIGAKDYYDGGKGFDTLRLTLTTAELRLAQEDITAFRAFLENGGKVFHFESIGLTVRNFEALQIVTLGGNTAPVAGDDSFTTGEDTIAGGNLLANDTDAEDARPAYVSAVNGAAGNVGATITLASGALLTVDAAGNFSFDPNGQFEALGDGEFADDSFTYVALDSQGANSNTATVNIQVAGANDAPLIVDDAIPADEDTVAHGNILSNDSDPDASDRLQLKVTSVNGMADNVGAQIVLASGALLTVNANGSVEYDPNGKFETLGVGDSIVEKFAYVASDPHGASASATATITVAGVNDAPVVQDITISGSFSGRIKVAVVGKELTPAGSEGSSYLAAADQLNPALFNVTAIAHTSTADWAAILAGYEVVVLGDDGIGADYVGSGIFGALRNFVDAGGGVVTTGWFATRLGEYTADPATAAADYITPVAPGAASFARSGATIEITDQAHPITSGISNYTVDAFAHDLAVSYDPNAKVLASWTPAGGGNALQAIAVDLVGAGRTAFLGSVYMANDAFSPSALRSGVADQIFERAVTWAAGTRESAATDEGTVLVIPRNTLISADADVDGDFLTIAFPLLTSVLGASLSTNLAGDVVYDPTTLLRNLAEGEFADDSFVFEVSDGNGGTDTATVSFKVLGLADPAPAAVSALASFEETLGYGLGLPSSPGDADTLLG